METAAPEGLVGLGPLDRIIDALDDRELCHERAVGYKAEAIWVTRVRKRCGHEVKSAVERLVDVAGGVVEAGQLNLLAVCQHGR